MAGAENQPNFGQLTSMLLEEFPSFRQIERLWGKIRSSGRMTGYSEVDL